MSGSDCKRSEAETAAETSYKQRSGNKMSIKTPVELRSEDDVLQELRGQIEILEAQEEIGLGATNLEFYKRLKNRIEGAGREAWSNKFLHEAKFVLIGIALATFVCYLG